MFRSFLQLCFVISLIVGLLSMIVGLAFGLWIYIRLTRDLPRIERISDYRPKAVTSVLAEDGTLIAEIFDERRYPVPFEEIPDVIKKAFLAAEDANFYSHPGFDVVSIVRALWVNLRSKKTRQGASTITQQIVKSLLLSREKTYERKAKEAILSYRLEKALTKDEIFSIYLNEIFLGSGAYGVKAAAKVHFHKELSELSLAEASFLAGLPQKPTLLSRPENREAADIRQHYVLDQMLQNRMITQKEYEEAKLAEVVVYPQEEQTIFAVPYFSRHVMTVLKDIFREIDIINMSPTSPGGFVVQTTADIMEHKVARRAVRNGLRVLDKRQGWRGVLGNVMEKTGEELLDWEEASEGEELSEGELYKAVVRKVNRGTGIAEVQVGKLKGSVDLKKAIWARRLKMDDGRVIGIRPERSIKPGNIIEVSLLPNKKNKKGKKQQVRFQLDQTPQVEGAMVVANALTGEVKVIIGGYDYRESQFNRATQAMLQPGSAFKPFIYLAALEHLHYTPATIVPDSPISMMGGDGKMWAPQNYDRKYLGPVTLRTALERSRNVVSVYLLKRVGVMRGVKSARKLGITSPIAPNMSISLGTAEVKPIEMVRAYGAFAAEGWLADSIVVKSIADRDGKVIYKKRTHQEKVISDEEAFLMANMMKGVVERGTARRVSKLGRPVAGKTGTTNDQMDAWFIGYTPEWVAGVWVGFDVKRTLGRFETGGKAAAPIFLEFMQEFLGDKPELDFYIPDGVIPVPINRLTGRLAEADQPGAFVEYFKSGTEPRQTRREVEIPRDYLTSDEF